MESLFKNETTEGLLNMLIDIRKEREKLQDEIDSCDDCTTDIKQELTRRGI